MARSGGTARPSDEPRLLKRIVELAGDYRQLTALLRHEGWTVDDKRAERLWHHEGLIVRQKHSKRKRLARRQLVRPAYKDFRCSTTSLRRSLT